MLRGSTGDGLLFGGDGQDFLSGATGIDFLEGNADKDVLTCGAGIDTASLDGKNGFQVSGADLNAFSLEFGRIDCQ